MLFPPLTAVPIIRCNIFNLFWNENNSDLPSRQKGSMMKRQVSIVRLDKNVPGFESI